MLLSGGIDSTVVATNLKLAHAKIHAVFLQQELVRHRQQTEHIVQYLNENFEGPDIEFHAADVQSLLHMLKLPDTGYVPGYQLFNHLVALAMADKYDTTFIYTGEIHNAVFVSNSTEEDADHHMYLDFLGKEDDTFYEAHYSTRDKMAEAYSYAYSGHTWGYRFIDPLLGLTKSQVTKLGVHLGAPLQLSVTCRAPDMDEWSSDDVFHCGRSNCYFCCHRRLGYLRAEIDDSVKYHVIEDLPPDIQALVNIKD